MSSTERGGKGGRRRLLPRPSARAAENYRKWILLSFLILTLAAFVIPAPPAGAASTSYATGTVNLALYDANITKSQTTVIKIVNYVVPELLPATNVSGIISITGDYQYVSTVTNNVSTTAQVTGAGVVRAGNVSVTLPTGAAGTTVLNYSSVSSSAAPIYLNGTITLYYKGNNGTASVSQPIAFGSGAYYVDESVAFNNTFDVPYRDAYYAVISVVAKSANGSVLDELTETISNPYYGEVHNEWFAQNIWIAAVALPAFNDTMLGAWVGKPTVLQPVLPIGGLYNITALIGLMLLAVSIPLSFFSKKHLNQALGDVAVGAAVILLFPYIYDHIAILMNYLNAYLIAYPQPYTMFLVRLWEIQTNIIVPPQWNLWTFFETAIFGIAYTVVWIITWIMLYLLGTVRILLLAAMLIMFPLSVALRDIRFTSKLGHMIEDTLFGIMLATILSSSALATVSWLLTNWNSENIFVIGGFQPQWVAIAGVLVAILAPTVLAPLTSTMYEVTSQVAMAGGSVAYMVGTEAVGGGVAGWQAVRAARGNIGKAFLGGIIGAGAYGGTAAVTHLSATPLMLGGSHGAVIGRMTHHAELAMHGPEGVKNSKFLNALASLLGKKEKGPERPPAGVA
ncbi:MAG: hypothetical protein RXS42_07675 [Nitrososphaeria archaeon]